MHYHSRCVGAQLNRHHHRTIFLHCWGGNTYDGTPVFLYYKGIKKQVQLLLEAMSTFIDGLSFHSEVKFLSVLSEN